jgi:hypothetical protein
MKPRERINEFRQAKNRKRNGPKWHLDQRSIANDDFPGTSFDGLFLECAETWTQTHRKDEDAAKKVKCPLVKHWLSPQYTAFSEALQNQHPERDRLEEEQETEKRADEFYAFVGHCLADACVKGESEILREMADALDQWTKHTPQPDKLRTALLDCRSSARLEPASMRDILQKLPRYGIRHTKDIERQIRRICKEIGLELKGKPGRPKAKNPDTKRPKKRH